MSGKITEGARHALLVATKNKGKLAELRALLADLPLDVFSVDDVGVGSIVVEEDGATFEANATKKARTFAAATMMLTLADDSGLEVDALGGRPGVRSARYAGEGASDAANNQRLLAELAGVPPPQRGARYRCVLAFVRSADDLAPLRVEGAWEGRIAEAPRGSGGFGYDPLFIPVGHAGTSAELAPEEKNRLSHRGQALRALVAQLAAGASAGNGTPP